MEEKKPEGRKRKSNATSFRKGQSGNPKGRPPQTQEQKDALAAIRELAPYAAQALEEMLRNPDTPAAVRAKLVDMVFDRTYGKPDMAVKVEDPKNDALSDIREQVARIKAAVGRE